MPYVPFLWPQVGGVLGKGGATITQVRKDSGAGVRLIPLESEDDRCVFLSLSTHSHSLNSRSQVSLSLIVQELLVVNLSYGIYQSYFCFVSPSLVFHMSQSVQAMQ